MLKIYEKSVMVMDRNLYKKPVPNVGQTKTVSFIIIEEMKKIIKLVMFIKKTIFIISTTKNYKRQK